MVSVFRVIEEALSANKGDKADHATRLKAVERYCELLRLAQGKVRPVEAKPVSEMTWEEFELLYQERNVGRQSE